jgi:hypothetical protein
MKPAESVRNVEDDDEDAVMVLWRMENEALGRGRRFLSWIIACATVVSRRPEGGGA